MLKRLMEHPGFETYDLSSLKLLTYGAAPMPFEVVRRAIGLFACDLMNAYGQTETTSSLTYLGPDDHRLDGTPAENKRKLQRLRSVGRPMDDVTLAIVGEDGTRLPAGVQGEICVRSARVMKQYLTHDGATAEAVVDGWLHTGDRGYLDEDGYLFITGRVKDLIIRGGENISPGEIEEVLDAHPAVAESAVIGVPDTEWGEAVKAIVVRKRTNFTARPEALEGRGFEEGEALRIELRSYCRERLASFKAPAYIAFVEALPRNAMGKVLKTDLRRDHGAADDA
jgi:acyl-CoA synthetase (AMP-forming)/AMP-acid ligase II